MLDVVDELELDELEPLGVDGGVPPVVSGTEGADGVVVTVTVGGSDGFAGVLGLLPVDGCVG